MSKTVIVNSGELHLVLDEKNELHFYENGGYDAMKGKAVVLHGSPEAFVITLSDVFCICRLDDSYYQYRKVKMDVQATFCLTDAYRLVNSGEIAVVQCLIKVVQHACEYTDLKSLVKHNKFVSNVAEDAMLEEKYNLAACGVEIKSFEVSNVRDAYDETAVYHITHDHEMLQALASAFGGGKPVIPSLNDVVAAELKSLE